MYEHTTVWPHHTADMEDRVQRAVRSTAEEHLWLTDQLLSFRGYKKCAKPQRFQSAGVPTPTSPPSRQPTCVAFEMVLPPVGVARFPRVGHHARTPVAVMDSPLGISCVGDQTSSVTSESHKSSVAFFNQFLGEGAPGTRASKTSWKNNFVHDGFTTSSPVEHSIRNSTCLEHKTTNKKNAATQPVPASTFPLGHPR